MMLDGVAGIRFLTKGETAHFKAILRAHFSFYRNLALIYKKGVSLGKINISAIFQLFGIILL